MPSQARKNEPKRRAPNRGAFDFETWEWTNPLCCGFVWGPPGERQEHWIHDRKAARPLDVARAALGFMFAAEAVDEWWAHNMGKFDGLLLAEAALSLGVSIHGVVTGSRAIRLDFKAKGRTIKVFDSYALVPAKLKSCADDFDLPSKKIFNESDYSVDPRKWDVARLRSGCLADCHVVLELLEHLEDQVEQWGGKLGLTFSSTALSVMRAAIAPRDIPSHEGQWRAQELSNLARYGGRVEIFHHSPRMELIEYDVTSSYPWAMSQALPWNLIGHSVSASGAAKVLSGKYEGPVEAIVRVPKNCSLPVLPVRLPGDGIYFPTGTFRGWWPAIELRYAVEQGTEVQPISAVAYQAAKPFAEVIAKVFQVKNTGKGAVRAFAKLVLNGAYGKLGQGPDTELLKVCANEEDALDAIHGAKPGKVRQLGDDKRMLTMSQYRWPKHTHYAASAYITAYSRILLHNALTASTGPAYCDTDSVHCALGSRLGNLEGTHLGGLKVEIPRYKGQFYAPKIYALAMPDGKMHFASKGFPVNEADFRTLVTGNAVKVERIQSLKTQLAKGGKVVRLQGETAEAKRWGGISSKRCPLPDGSTRPWTYTELIEKKHKEAKCPIMGNEFVSY